MKSGKQFFIISSILHLLLFIVLAYIILPPVDRFKEFFDKLHVDIVKLKPVEPVPRREIPSRAATELDEKSVAPQSPKPPELEAFSLSVEESASSHIRIASSERESSLRILPKERGMVSVRPRALKPIYRSTDDQDMAPVPDFHQGGGDLADATGTVDFPGSGVGPIGGRAGVKGATASYVSLGAALQQRRGADEFAEILPALARGILERSIQKKADIVFVIDTTGSMRDNVRGVKDYIHYFLEPMEEKGIDAALGLVKFADLEVKKAKVVGLTRSQKKFKKWLDGARFFGGEDIPESGYEALIAALEETDFRDGAQRFFIFISDAPQHDFDYDGKSRYSLDRIIARLSDEGVRVDVVGANYLSMKQLAWGTGGQWKHIPGGDPVVDVPHLASSMIRSSLDRSLPPVPVEDKVTIEFSNSVPDWVDLSYKMLDPLGFKCLGTLTYRIKIREKAERVDFSPKIDLRKFRDQPGTYTLIYRIRDSIGNWDVLRRTLELRRE